MKFSDLLSLSLKSLWSRKVSSFLCILTIALSVFLLLGMERLRSSAKSSFESTISGVDLIVGARSGSLPTLLYTVFRLGNPTNNISWQEYLKLKDDPRVGWLIPISLGDSHREFRVVATNEDFFTHFRYNVDQALNVKEGSGLKNLFDVVLGSEVAKAYKYKVGQKIIVSHGVDSTGLQDHDNLPFTISGILAPTGTPVDRSLHITLEAMEAIHYDWQNGIAPAPDKAMKGTEFVDKNLQPQAITAIFVGLKSKMQVFTLQREINDQSGEPLSAILPGVALQELWRIMDGVETIFLSMTLLVFFVSLISIFLALQSAFKDRRRELAIFRAIGARPIQLLLILLLDSVWLSLSGILIGFLGLIVSLVTANSFLQNSYGLGSGLFAFGVLDSLFVIMVFVGALLAALLPAVAVYKQALQDGLSIKG
jgi:putative ABC transport system permease protein